MVVFRFMVLFVFCGRFVYVGFVWLVFVGG